MVGLVLESEERVTHPKGQKTVARWHVVFWHEVGVTNPPVWHAEPELVLHEPAEPADTALMHVAQRGREDAALVPGVEELRGALNDIIRAARALGRVEGAGGKAPIHQYARLIHAKAQVYTWARDHAASAEKGPVRSRRQLFGGRMCSGLCGRKSLPGRQFCQVCFGRAQAALLADRTPPIQEEE